VDKFLPILGLGLDFLHLEGVIHSVSLGLVLPFNKLAEVGLI